MVLGWSADAAVAGEFGEPPHWQHDIEVFLSKPRIDVHVVEPHIALRRAEWDDAKACIAPPRVASLVFLVEGFVIVACDACGRDERYRAVA